MDQSQLSKDLLEDLQNIEENILKIGTEYFQSSLH